MPSKKLRPNPSTGKRLQPNPSAGKKLSRLSVDKKRSSGGANRAY